MAVYNIDIIEPLQGKDIGLILGIPHTGVSLGTGDAQSKTFLIPTLPVFDRECDDPVPDEKDITVYVDGTEVTTGVTLTEAKTGGGYDTVTFTAAPADKKKVTIDYLEEMEPYIATALKVEPKYDSKDYGRLRSPLNKTQYGARSVTISLDLLFADLEFMSIFFDSTTGKMLGQPPVVYGYVPMMEDDVEIGRMYFTHCRIIPKTLVDVKASDQAAYSLELSVDEDPVLWQQS